MSNLTNKTEHKALTIIAKMIIEFERLHCDSKDLEMFNNIFTTIEEHVLIKENFKDSNITISSLASQLSINNNYLSKAIRINGYTNFNHYINTIRINHAKNLLSSEDMHKLTLLYIYTESGFTSQTTFNRVFKQIEGITPSEFMKNLENK